MLKKMIYIKNLLLYILILPLIGTFLLLITPANKQKTLKLIALNCSCLTFVCSLYLWVIFSEVRGTFQFITKILWINILNLNFTLGIDGISLFFFNTNNFIMRPLLFSKLE
jgi:NADH-quinone oxidoreductase subunit M